MIGQNEPRALSGSRKVVVSPVSVVHQQSFPNQSVHYNPHHPQNSQFPNQPYSKFLQNTQYVNPNVTMSPARRLSPHSPQRFDNSGYVRPRFIELGGSRERAQRRSRERSGSNCSTDGFRNQNWANQSWANQSWASQSQRSQRGSQNWGNPRWNPEWATKNPNGNWNSQNWANQSNRSWRGQHQKDFSFHPDNMVTQDFGTDHEAWKKKCYMLQDRMKQIYLEKNTQTLHLNNRITELQRENVRLNNLLKENGYNRSTERSRSRSRSNQSVRSHRSRMSRRDFATSMVQSQSNGFDSFSNPNFNNEGGFSVEEMLANQIDVNLELREQIEKYCEELDQYRAREETLATELLRYKDENAEIKLQNFQTQDGCTVEEVRTLREKISYLEDNLYKKDADHQRFN